jgi:hypothetical protein
MAHRCWEENGEEGELRSEPNCGGRDRSARDEVIGLRSGGECALKPAHTACVARRPPGSANWEEGHGNEAAKARSSEACRRATPLSEAASGRKILSRRA